MNFKLTNPGKRLTWTHIFVYVGSFSIVLAAYLWYAPKLIKKPETAAPRAGSPDSMSTPQLAATVNQMIAQNPSLATQIQSQVLPAGGPNVTIEDLQKAGVNIGYPPIAGAPPPPGSIVTPGTVPTAVYGFASPAPPLPMTPSGA